ncbi:MAG: hypothetical protein JXB50_08390 [Spirochaetes bacterium]|nr:hypothetical protein [Spirochaetota bacterium]
MKNDQINSFKEKISLFLDLDKVNIDKFYDELLNVFSETEKDYISRRHKELKKIGYKNKEIYPLIINEVSNCLFKGNIFTERQIKRIIYGD